MLSSHENLSGHMLPAVLDDGFIFSSKHFLNNIPRSYASMNEKWTVGIDGTFNLTSGGWVLLVLGTHSVEVERTSIHHTCRPFLFCWTKSENIVATEAIMTCLHKCASTFFDISFSISAASIDQTDAFYSGISNIDNTVTILNCFFHMTKSIKSNIANPTTKVRKISDNLNKKTILSDIKILSTVCTKNAFTVLSELACVRWEGIGESVFADYFRDTYMKKWSGWYISVTDLYGIGLTTNYLEAMNATIKQILSKSTTPREAFQKGFQNLLSALSKTANSGSPIIRNLHLNQYNNIVRLFPIPPKMLLKARDIINAKQHRNTLKHPDIRYFNSSTQLNKPICAERIRLFKLFMEGILSVDNKNWKNASLISKSLHQVRKITLSDGTVLYICTCKSYRHSGYICSHVLVCIHVPGGGEADIIKMTQSFGGKQKPGRKPSNAKLGTRKPTNKNTTLTVTTINIGDTEPIHNPRSLVGMNVCFPKNQMHSIINYNNNLWELSPDDDDVSHHLSETEVRAALSRFTDMFSGKTPITSNTAVDDTSDGDENNNTPTDNSEDSISLTHNNTNNITNTNTTSTNSSNSLSHHRIEVSAADEHNAWLESSQQVTSSHAHNTSTGHNRASVSTSEQFATGQTRINSVTNTTRSKRVTRMPAHLRADAVPLSVQMEGLPAQEIEEAERHLERDKASYRYGQTLQKRAKAHLSLDYAQLAAAQKKQKSGGGGQQQQQQLITTTTTTQNRGKQKQSRSKSPPAPLTEYEQEDRFEEQLEEERVRIQNDPKFDSSSSADWEYTPHERRERALALWRLRNIPHSLSVREEAAEEAARQQKAERDAHLAQLNEDARLDAEKMFPKPKWDDPIWKLLGYY